MEFDNHLIADETKSGLTEDLQFADECIAIPPPSLTNTAWAVKGVKAVKQGNCVALSKNKDDKILFHPYCLCNKPFAESDSLVMVTCKKCNFGLSIKFLSFISSPQKLDKTDMHFKTLYESDDCNIPYKFNFDSTKFCSPDCNDSRHKNNQYHVIHPVMLPLCNRSSHMRFLDVIDNSAFANYGTVLSCCIDCANNNKNLLNEVIVPDKYGPNPSYSCNIFFIFLSLFFYYIIFFLVNGLPPKQLDTSSFKTYANQFYLDTVIDFIKTTNTNHWTEVNKKKAAGGKAKVKKTIKDDVMEQEDSFQI